MAPPAFWKVSNFNLSDTFDAKLALFYLHRYPKSTGIQFHITQHLKTFPTEQIEFLLPEICHLLISKPNDSAFLENFIIELCTLSNHMAILVYLNIN